MFDRIDTIIAGAGISGLTAARSLAEQGHNVLVVEKMRHIGGHCSDYVNDHGIMVQPYGPHIFHSDNETVWNFLSRFTDWYPYNHKVTGYIDGQLIPIPFNLNTLRALLPQSMAGRIEEKLLQNFSLGERVPILKLQEAGDKDLNFLATFVYEKVFLNYTLKQWGGKRPEDLDPSVSARVPVVISHDDRYFNDRFQGIPVKGYSQLLENMADHPHIQLLLNTDIKELIHLRHGETIMNGRLYEGQYIYTGPIDELLDYELGTLPYRSVNIEFESFPSHDNFQTSSVVNYPNNYDFTRITEYRHFQRNPVEQYTTISREYPAEYVKGKTPPFYVIDSEESRTLYASYKQQVASYGNIHCLGRLGEYRYYDMDDAVSAALSLTKSL